MEYIIAVFQARNNALKCNNILRSSGLDITIISTPKIKGLGCGISIKIKKRDFLLAKTLVYGCNLGDFLGFYEIKKERGELVANKI